MSYYVYIMASRKHGTLYTGVTSQLDRRVGEHRNGVVEGFTRKYDVKRLVYAEPFDQIADAIAFEKRLKRWRRAWKIQLIEKVNPDWEDLADTLYH